MFDDSNLDINMSIIAPIVSIGSMSVGGGQDYVTFDNVDVKYFNVTEVPGPKFFSAV